MGASSSGLLDEAKINNIKGLVNSSFQSFSVFYRQQFSAAYIGHLHQEVEPKKEGKGLLLTRGPLDAPEEVIYRGSVKFSCWDEPGKKCRERYAVLRRDYRVEIHENMEAFSRGGAAKLVLRPVGGRVFTTEEESRAHLELTCAGMLNGVKEDSSSVGSSPDVPAVYLHLPYMGHTCFLFRQEEERDNFLSALKTCIRHGNLDPWCEPSYESQAFIRALRLYRQDKGCYESWEMLLGTEEQVLASQVMEEVLSWLQSQLPSKVKAKKTERIRQWLATVQATYTLVLEQLTTSLEALREECRQTASANQALIRSNLDQIISSRCFLEEKVKVCIREEAEEVCSESVAPYMSSILDALTENISAGIQAMQHILHTKMDSAFSHTNGPTEDTKQALSPLRSISLDQCYRQVENLTDKLDSLKQRFGLSSTQRLVHSAHLEMEKLLDSAVYTLELFLQSSARLQPSQVPVKMEKAKERVLKQLDYDSRVVQRRIYQEALLEITLPALTSRMDSKWKSQLQQFEQYIFSDYSSFILVHNVYDDVLRNLLSEEIEKVVQDAASKKNNRLLLDTSDLTISQYSLLGQTPPLSAPDSPAAAARDVSSAAPGEGEEPVEEDGGQMVTAEADPPSDPDLNTDAKSDPSIPKTCDQSAVLPSPVIIVTQEFDEPATEQKEVQSMPSITESTAEEPSEPATPEPNAPEGGRPDPDAAEGGRPDPDAAESGRPDPEEAEHGRPDPAENGTPDPEAAEGGRPDPAEGGRPDPDTAEGGRPDPDAAEGGRPDPEAAEHGRPDPAEGGRPDPDAADGGRPDPDAAEVGRPDPDAAEGGRPDPEAAEGGRPDPAEGGIPDPDAAEGGRPDPDAAEGGRPDPDAAEGGRPDPDAAEGGTPDPEAAEGGKPDPAEGGIPDPDAAEGGRPDPEAAEGGKPDPAEGGRPDPDAAEGGRPDPAEGGRPDPAEGGRPDPDAAEGGRSDPDPADGGTPGPDPNSLDSSVSTRSSSQSTDVPAVCAESDRSEAPDLSTSVQHPCISSCTDHPVKISLVSLSEAISGDSTAPPMSPTTPQHTTDRAVYLTGEIKDNWEVERVKEEKQVCDVRTKDETEEEKGKGQMLVQSGGEDGGCRSSEERDGELEEKDEKGDDGEKEGREVKEDEVLQSPVSPPPLDSVAAIRELVTEITEVEMVISPCP